MPLVKHKLFKVKVSDDGKFTLSKSVEKTIDTFLNDPNNVYVNHSVTTLTEDVEEFDSLRTVCRFVLISIVYKDLASSSLNVRSTSKKVKTVVHKQIESGQKIDEPDIQTALDKEVLEFEPISQMLKNI